MNCCRNITLHFCDNKPIFMPLTGNTSTICQRSENPFFVFLLSLTAFDKAMIDLALHIFRKYRDTSISGQPLFKVIFYWNLKKFLNEKIIFHHRHFYSNAFILLLTQDIVVSRTISLFKIDLQLPQDYQNAMYSYHINSLFFFEIDALILPLKYNTSENVNWLYCLFTLKYWEI